MPDFIHSTILFNYPSFQKGAARTMDLFGNLDQYNSKPTEEEADTEELKRDWYMVGRDIFTSLINYGKTE